SNGPAMPVGAVRVFQDKSRGGIAHAFRADLLVARRMLGLPARHPDSRVWNGPASPPPPFPAPTSQRALSAFVASGRRRSCACDQLRPIAATSACLLAGARFTHCGRFRMYRARDDRQSTPLPIEPDGPDL